MIISKMVETERQFFNSSTVLFLLILLLKLAVTLVALFLYSKLVPFVDAERYLNASLPSFDLSLVFNRTLFTDFIYSTLKYLLVSKLLVHLFISAFTACIIWYVVNPYYPFTNHKLLFCCFCLPHFLIWTSVVSKEALAIAAFFIIIKACIDISVKSKPKMVPLLLGMLIALIERPHYMLAYLYLFSLSLLIAKSKLRLMSLFSFKQTLMILSSIIIYLIVVYFCLYPIISVKLMKYMYTTQQYFLKFSNSASNRFDIIWEQPCDFFKNLNWGLPASIIGPFYYEAVKRLELIPAFIEGVFSLILMIIIFFILIQFIKKNPPYRTLLIWGFFPSVIIALLINYPFGIFNPGSAIRYKQSLVPLLYFYPLLLMAAIKKIQR